MRNFELFAALAEIELNHMVVDAKMKLKLYENTIDGISDILDGKDPLFLGADFSVGGGVMSDKVLKRVEEMNQYESKFSYFFLIGFNNDHILGA